jgi:protease I
MKRIVIFVEDLYEDLELWYPKMRLEEEGHKVMVAGPTAGGRIYNGKHGYPCKADVSIDQIESKAFDAMMIPGGFAPDKLRRIKKLLDLTAEFHAQGKLIAFICHGGWVPISAKILKGKKATSFIAIKDDMENAGCIWSDEAVVVDKNLISSRTPVDLPFFSKAMIAFLNN